MRFALRASVVAVLVAVVAACSTLGVVTAWLNDQVAFTAPQLQRSLDKRFPRTFDKLGGLVSVTMVNPRLSILHAEYARTEPVYRLDPGLLARLPASRRISDVGIARGVVVVHLDR